MQDYLALSGVLEQADSRLRSGSHAAPRIWPSGFLALDTVLHGGFRSGELILLAGPQGLGKTTFALQVLRFIASLGRSSVYFSFEHDQQTLLERLIAMEAAEQAGVGAVTLDRVRRAFESSHSKRLSLVDRLAETPGGVEALESMTRYGDRLVLHRSTGASTTLDAIRDVVNQVRKDTASLPFLVVDYLQKVKIPYATETDDDRIAKIVEGLKDLALEIDVPVFAIVAADKGGVVAGKRMRTQHMRGSTALAYEADTVLIMNEKFDTVARHHLVYDVGNAERFKDWAIISIEKNRNGVDKVDLEFRKRFEQSRFEREGRRVTETLMDERVFVE